VRAARKKAAELAAAGGKDATAGRRRGRLTRAVNDLTELLEATLFDKLIEPIKVEGRRTPSP
jgi:hypothetical protein